MPRLRAQRSLPAPAPESPRGAARVLGANAVRAGAAYTAHAIREGGRAGSKRAQARGHGVHA
eukprot:5097387-Lingulodinium_polyedra.AAC.1